MNTQTTPFQLEATDQHTSARAGKLRTAHGEIPTPVFMPVGTQGAVKAMDHRTLRELDVPIILANTYHMYLRPGTETLKAMGGLHTFSTWDRPILTDSGGFQVFSLKDLRKMREEGVEFQSHLDGSRHLFTPESVVDTQRAIGSDVFMVLDECTPYPATYTEARESMELTLRWAKRGRAHHLTQPFLYGHHQLQFGIGQGSTYKDLRQQCMDELVAMDFEGYAIGGLSVGEPAQNMYEITAVSTERMPSDKARYLMGVGTPENIIRCIGLGVDMFDCVMPTRNARNGTLFTTQGRVNIKNATWKQRNEPIDQFIGVQSSANYSMAYLRHLFNAGEILGLMIATAQNIGLYMWLVRQAREKILDGTFRQWSVEIIEQLNQPRT
jgi:queuine tRNA-ribosyltransferase